MSAAHAFDTALPADRYLVPEKHDVLCFLGEHPGLDSLLEAAPGYVERAFGQRLPMRLTVFRDADEPSFSQLLVEVLTGRTGEDAWAAADSALHLLHETWLVSLPRHVTRNILFVAEPS